MAMTKKEQAAVAALENRIDLLEGWVLPPVARPVSLPKPTEAGKVQHGWTYNVYKAVKMPYDVRASQAVSEVWRTMHYHYSDASLKHGSQGEVSLYSSRSEALLALYFEIQEVFASTLGKIRSELLKGADDD